MERISRRCFIIIFYTSISLFLLGTPTSIYSFKNIHDMVAYVNQHDEYPASDLDLEGKQAQLNPTFHIFYPTIDSGILGRLFCHLGIFKPLWCFSDFISALQKLYDFEQNKPWQKSKNTISQYNNVTTALGCVCKENTTFYIIGELSGAFHSLARIVEYWYKNNIISENFTLLKNTDHIILLGDVIGSSAYNLETLTLLGNLYSQNTDHIWYLCGAAENKQRWHETPLYHAINIRSNFKRSALRDTYKIIDDLFSFLPDAFVIISTNQKKAIVCSAAHVFDDIDISKLIACNKKFISQDITACRLVDNSEAEDSPEIIALLETRRAWQTLFITPPLEKTTLPSIKGPVWDLISGTTRGLRAVYRVRWNGYFVLQPHGENLEKSTLEYIGRRADFDDTFKSRQIYNVTTGELITQELQTME